jgi:hypothetical protein
VKGGTRRLLHRNEEENKGVSSGEPRGEKDGGGGSGAGMMWREGEWGPASGSYAGAMETGAGRAVSDAVWKQGSERCTWAARECMGRPGEGMSWAGPERTVPFCN